MRVQTHVHRIPLLGANSSTRPWKLPALTQHLAKLFDAEEYYKLGAELETAGFEVVVEDVPLVPGDPDDGRVISQDPAGPSRADRGSTVTIRVGRASDVPDP